MSPAHAATVDSLEYTLRSSSSGKQSETLSAVNCCTALEHDVLFLLHGRHGTIENALEKGIAVGRKEGEADPRNSVTGGSFGKVEEFKAVVRIKLVNGASQESRIVP